MPNNVGGARTRVNVCCISGQSDINDGIPTIRGSFLSWGAPPVRNVSRVGQIDQIDRLDPSLPL